MARLIVIIIIAVAVMGGVVFAFREPIGCFFYLRSSHESQIAFFRDDGVYVMEPDGSNQCRILEDNYYLELGCSHDGQQLALFNLDGNLYTAQPNGSELRQIVSATNTEDRMKPTWSPDGTEIAYVRNADAAGVYVVDVVSGNELRITQELSAQFPIWSPVEDWIAFVTEDNGLYVVRADGSELTRLSDAALFDDPPSWSPDGDHIAFMNMDYEISLVEPTGTDEEVITNFHDDYDGQVFFVTWSPVGDQIGAEVIRHSPFRTNLFVIDVATGETRSLTPREENISFAEWTPDGAQLLYTQIDIQGQVESALYRVNVASGLIERLAPGSEASARLE